MTTSKEIHDLVSVYLKTQDLDAFSASFAEMFYDIEKTGDETAIQLAYDVESLLAATTAGVCSETSLHEALQTLSPSLSTIVVCGEIKSQGIAPYELLMKFAAAAGTGKLVHVGISPSVGFGSTTDLPSTHQTNTGLPRWQQVIPA